MGPVLATPFIVTSKVVVPASVAGVTNVSSVSDRTSTDCIVARGLTANTWATPPSDSSPTPVKVTLVPPATGPVVGEMAVIVGP